MKAAGWAVRAVNGAMLIRTVSDTRRAAIVNFLVSDQKVMITNFHTDDDIEHLWRYHGTYFDCVPVEVVAVTSERGT